MPCFALTLIFQPSGKTGKHRSYFIVRLWLPRLPSLIRPLSVRFIKLSLPDGEIQLMFSEQDPAVTFGVSLL